MAETYSQSYSGFVGVDFTSDPACVARNRLAHSVNMWRDYDSENGAAIETFPGFRSVVGLDDSCGDILKVYHFKPDDEDYLIIHATKGIFAVKVEDITKFNEKGEPIEKENIKSAARIDVGVTEEYSRSLGFVQNNRLYIISNVGYYYVAYDKKITVCEIMNNKKANLSRKWRWDDFVDCRLDGFDYRVDFMCAEVQYYGFVRVPLDTSENPQYGMAFYKNPITAWPYEIVYTETEKWEDSKFRIIDFGESAIDETIKSFLEKYAQKIVNIPTSPYIPTEYYNGKKYEQRNMLSDMIYQVEGNGGIESVAKVPDEINSNDGTVASYKEINVIDYSVLEDIRESTDSIYASFSKKYEITVTVDDKIFYSTKSDYESALIKDDVYMPLCKYTQDDKGTRHYILTGIRFARSKIFNMDGTQKKVSILYNALDPISFNTIEEGRNKTVASLEYGGTSVDAILGCTKVAVYDGRVFLTGNPALPNTVFYSARNSTGANDPTYFGVYNYFNDGYGNTPNVDLLSTTSMLMVIKQDTVQDGSVYYHTGMDNTDEDSMNLIPRIYPSTSGAAGIGSVATLDSRGVLSCNFLDDAVFLSRRGLEGVSKQTVNLERTIGHRSTFVDKLLSHESLSGASMAEWKGYLVICCNGHIYLADSRSMSQTADGSYQYEWFYLEGLVTRGNRQTFVYAHPSAEWIPDGYKENANEDTVNSDEVITVEIDGVVIYYVMDGEDKYLVEPQGWKSSNNKIKDVLAVGEVLFLISDKNICIVNTDMERDELGRLKADAYSFDGCGYVSGCSTRLDDCGQLTFRKNTLFGYTVARFKTLIGSRCSVKTSTDGRSFDKICDVDNNRNDYDDFDFANASYDGDADHVAVLPERSRGWVRKQYYFYSDGFCQPFGLYEMSYHYQPTGKIRY